MSEFPQVPSPSPSTPTYHECEKLDLKSIQELVLLVNQHIQQILEHQAVRKSLQSRCTSKLTIHKQLLQSSEHSVVSNLYWGIENVEVAIQAKSPEERTSRLKNSEQMLQAPALLDEDGSTSGIPNHYLVCYSYFYLSLVGKLQKDEWQATLHFLQALLVYPRLIRMELSPDLWESLFVSQQKMGEWRHLALECLVRAGDDAIDDATRQLARRYKHWLMYYQVMLYGGTPQRNRGCRVAPLLEDKSQCFS